ncbi:hypothetical protein MKW92_006420, partial [Papaver armeniacum]
SERSHQSTITQLRSDLAKVRKDHMSLEVSHANLEVSLSASRDRERRRLAHTQSFMEINARNLERGAIHKAHASAQSVVNGILLSKSLPTVNIPPLNISEDEEYPKPDNDYEFVSDDENDQEDEENQLEKDKPAGEINVEAENPGPEKSLVEQDVVVDRA